MDVSRIRVASPVTRTRSVDSAPERTPDQSGDGGRARGHHHHHPRAIAHRVATNRTQTPDETQPTEGPDKRNGRIHVTVTHPGRTGENEPGSQLEGPEAAEALLDSFLEARQRLGVRVHNAVDNAEGQHDANAISTLR